MNTFSSFSIVWAMSCLSIYSTRDTQQPQTYFLLLFVQSFHFEQFKYKLKHFCQFMLHYSMYDLICLYIIFCLFIIKTNPTYNYAYIT